MRIGTKNYNQKVDYALIIEYISIQPMKRIKTSELNKWISEYFNLKPETPRHITRKLIDNGFIFRRWFHGAWYTELN
jgi:hypothetical protein